MNFKKFKTKFLNLFIENNITFKDYFIFRMRRISYFIIFNIIFYLKIIYIVIFIYIFIYIYIYCIIFNIIKIFSFIISNFPPLRNIHRIKNGLRICLLYIQWSKCGVGVCQFYLNAVMDEVSSNGMSFSAM